MSYAVLFYSLKNDYEQKEYESMALEMEGLVLQQEGYLEHFSFRNADGYGITISYWDSLESISAWKQNAEHQQAQKKGRENWYKNYRLEICKIEQSYDFNRN